jgi:hypothetical protein
MTPARRATIQIEPLVVAAVIALLIGLSLFGPPPPRGRGVWGSPYHLAVVALCAVGLALIAWCGARYFRRARRTRQVLGRGGMVYRKTAPIAFWMTLLSAMFVFFGAGAFCVVIALMKLW